MKSIEPDENVPVSVAAPVKSPTGGSTPPATAASSTATQRDNLPLVPAVSGPCQATGPTPGAVPPDNPSMGPFLQPEKKSEFREKLILMLVEKGVLALVFVFIGLAVSKNLEEVRARQARANFVAERALKVLDELNQPLAEVYRVIEKIEKLSDAGAKAEATGELNRPVREIQSRLGEAADSTWITPGAAEELTKILGAITRKRSADITVQDAREIRQGVEKLKRQIIDHPVSDS